MGYFDLIKNLSEREQYWNKQDILVIQMRIFEISMSLCGNLLKYVLHKANKHLLETDIIQLGAMLVILYERIAKDEIR